MKKKSIIAIMMLITLSTAMFVGCNNNKNENQNEKAKVEASINNNDTNNLKNDYQNRKDEKEIANNINEQKNKKEEKNNSKDLNKNTIKNKNTNQNKSTNENKKQNESSNFTPQKAIEIAKQKYGTQKGNILYSYKEEPYISGDKKGYYIKLSSKTMIEQGGTGTLTWLLVTNDGKIIEDPRMN